MGPTLLTVRPSREARSLLRITRLLLEGVTSDRGDADCHQVLSPLLSPFMDIVAATPVAALTVAGHESRCVITRLALNTALWGVTDLV